MALSLDYEALCKPYEEGDTPEEKRTPAGQRKWMTGKRHEIPEAVADLAMQDVYSALQAGKIVFPNGDKFDKYLLTRALQILAEMQAQAGRVGQDVFNRAVARQLRTRRQARKPKHVFRHPLKAAKHYRTELVAFALGAAAAGIAWLASTL